MQTCPECGVPASASPCDACGHVLPVRPSSQATDVALPALAIPSAPVAIDLPDVIDLGEPKTAAAPAHPSSVPPPIDLDFLQEADEAPAPAPVSVELRPIEAIEATVPLPAELDPDEDAVASAPAPLSVNLRAPDFEDEPAPASVELRTPDEQDTIEISGAAALEGDAQAEWASPHAHDEIPAAPAAGPERWRQFASLQRLAPWQLVPPMLEDAADAPQAVAATSNANTPQVSVDADEHSTSMDAVVSLDAHALDVKTDGQESVVNFLVPHDKNPAASADDRAYIARAPASIDDIPAPVPDESTTKHPRNISILEDLDDVTGETSPNEASEHALAPAAFDELPPLVPTVPEATVADEEPSTEFKTDDASNEENAEKQTRASFEFFAERDDERPFGAPSHDAPAAELDPAIAMAEMLEPEESAEPWPEAADGATDVQALPAERLQVASTAPGHRAAASVTQMEPDAGIVETEARDLSTLLADDVDHADATNGELLDLIESELYEEPATPAQELYELSAESLSASIAELVDTLSASSLPSVPDTTQAPASDTAATMLQDDDPEAALLAVLGAAGHPADAARIESQPAEDHVHAVQDEEEDPEMALLAVLGTVRNQNKAAVASSSSGFMRAENASEPPSAPRMSSIHQVSIDEGPGSNLADLLEPDSTEPAQSKAKHGFAETAANEDFESVPAHADHAEVASSDRAPADPSPDDGQIPGTEAELSSEPLAALHAELKAVDTSAQIHVLARHLAELEERAQRAERRNRFLQERLKLAEERVQEAEKQSKRASSMASRLEQMQDDLAVLKKRSRSRLQVDAPPLPPDADADSPADTPPSHAPSVRVDDDLDDAVENFFGPTTGDSTEAPTEAAAQLDRASETQSDAKSEASKDASAEARPLLGDQEPDAVESKDETESEIEDDDLDVAQIEVISRKAVVDDESDDAEEAIGDDEISDLAAVLGFQTDDDDGSDAPQGSISVPVGPPPAETNETSSPQLRIGDSLEDRLAAYVEERAESMRLNLSDEGIRETLEVEFFTKEVAASLRKEGAPDLRRLSERLRDLKPDDPTALAGISYCRFLESPTPSAQEDALRELREVQDRFPKAADVHLATGTALFTQGRLLPARGALRMAAQLRPGDPRVTALVKKIDAQKDKQPGARGERQGVAATQSLLFCALIVGAVGFLSVLLEMGAGEDIYNPTQPMWWIRRGVLLVGAFLGILIFDTRRFSGIGARIRFDSDFRTFLLCVGGGCVAGYLTGVGDQLSMGLATALGCALATVSIDRFFFSMFLTEDVLEMSDHTGLVVAMTAPLYSVYMVLTYTSSWQHVMAMPILLCIFAVMGAVYAAIHAWTRSTVLVWLTELCITITAILVHSKY